MRGVLGGVLGSGVLNRRQRLIAGMYTGEVGGFFCIFGATIKVSLKRTGIQFRLFGSLPRFCESVSAALGFL